MTNSEMPPSKGILHKHICNMYIYIVIYLFIYTLYMNKSTYIYIHNIICMHIYIHTYICIYIYIHTCVYILYIHIYTHMFNTRYPGVANEILEVKLNPGQ